MASTFLSPSTSSTAHPSITRLFKRLPFLSFPRLSPIPLSPSFFRPYSTTVIPFTSSSSPLSSTSDKRLKSRRAFVHRKSPVLPQTRNRAILGLMIKAGYETDYTDPADIADSAWFLEDDDYSSE